MVAKKIKRGLGMTAAVVTLGLIGTLGRDFASAAPVLPTPTPSPTASPAPTPAPVLAPGDSGPRVRAAQSRLRQLGWFTGKVIDAYGPRTTTAVTSFQVKHGLPATGALDAVTLGRLRAMTRTPTRDELANRHGSVVWTGAALDQRCRTGRTLCIDKSGRTLRWVVGGEVRETLAVRFGASGTPTREGLFHVGRKSRHHVSNLYGSSMPFAMFFSGGQAVHYSSDFAARGYNGASHGCVNVRDYKGLQKLFDQVKVGDKVVVYWS